MCVCVCDEYVICLTPARPRGSNTRGITHRTERAKRLCGRRSLIYFYSCLVVNHVSDADRSDAYQSVLNLPPLIIDVKLSVTLFRCISYSSQASNSTTPSPLSAISSHSLLICCPSIISQCISQAINGGTLL